jgi:putative DNA methylase
MTYRKKLIEVALPLDAINKASAKEKSIRHGHPSTLHLWWARRPLAACRAVLFASLVDDPSEHPELFPTEEAQEQERERLFRLIEQLVLWENSNNEDVLQKAQAEILKSTGGNPPPVLDPFAGGGSIPLEAQRLGLQAYASDLNPVAVLINKALIEIPPKFAGRPPVNPEAQHSLMGSDWHGARGLADDIRYYGKWMRNEAEKRIGYLYPKVTLPKEYGGGEATVIAWLWARTVTCPNPACGVKMPLVHSFYVSKKKGKEVWVEPHVDYSVTPPDIRFIVTTGKGKPQDGTVNRQGARCIACGTPIGLDYMRSAGKTEQIGTQLMAIVAEGQHRRVYLSPNEDQINVAIREKSGWIPEQSLPDNPRWFSPPLYGLSTYGDLFTARQLVALTTFSDLVQELLQEEVLADAQQAGMLADGIALNDGGTGVNAYADAVATYLAFTLDKLADLANQLCRWEPVAECPRQLFGRQAIPMVWDFAEGNPFGASSGSWLVLLDNLLRSFQSPLMAHERPRLGIATQLDARILAETPAHFIVSTDPPYYDNIGYAVM